MAIIKASMWENYPRMAQYKGKKRKCCIEIDFNEVQGYFKEIRQEKK